MAFVMIDDLTGEQHPVEASHRLFLQLDGHRDDGYGPTEIAAWDVASTDPRELLAQLGEHLSGIAAPLASDRGPLPGIESLRQALAGVRAPVRVTVEQPDEQEVGDEDVVADAPESAVPEQCVATAPARVGEALGGEATDAVVRAWAAHYAVPCSMTGKLNGWARAAYLRVRGGEPDEQMWRDAGIPIATTPQPSTPVAPSAVETPPSSDPGPPSGRAAAGPPAPDRAARGPADSPAPAPTGEGGAGAGEVQAGGDGDGERPPGVTTKAMRRAEELAADGRTPREIRERTGVPLEVARELYASAKGGSR